MSAELLRATRGNLVETIQRGHVAVVDARGRLLAAAGEPDTFFYMRSSAKPLQATAVVESGATERFDLSGRLLAICCASHNGEPGHVEAVRGVLGRAGVPESALQCGVHPPSYTPAAAALWRAGQEPLPVHNNCSGKHSGMLAASRAMDAPLERYLSPEHPVQQRILRTIAALSHMDPGDIALGTDGCSVPVHGLPVRAMAQAYAHLADPASAPAEHGATLMAIGEAMTAHPWYIDGTGGADTLMMERAEGRLAVKGGAEGVLCVAVRDAGVGLALKIEGGRGDRAHAIAIEALRQLDLLSDSEVAAMGDLARPPILNHRRLVVGEAYPTLQLER